MKKILASILMLYATAIDGDSIMYNNQDMRLFGIDAPEYHQQCLDENSKTYHCGDIAYKELQKLLKNPTECKVITKDRYQRKIVVCDDVNRQMVLSGWALSYYSDKYKSEEQNAKDNKRGLWQGKFMRPDLYRALNRKKKN